jgi:Rieske Fe-S protein
MIDKENSRGNGSRRDFLKKGLEMAGFAVVAAATASAFQSCEYDWQNAPVTFGVTVEEDIGAIEALQEIGSGTIRKYSNVNYGIPVVLVRVSGYEIACFSSLCPHDNCMGNDLWVQKRRSVVVCSCHGSKFDAKNGGAVLKGPAEKPLRQFPTEFDRDTNMLKIFF